MKNNNRKSNFYTQGQQFAARVLLILWLLASSSPEGVLAYPKSQKIDVKFSIASILKASILGLLTSGSSSELIPPRQRGLVSSAPDRPNYALRSNVTLPEYLNKLRRVACSLSSLPLVLVAPTNENEEDGEKLGLEVSPEKVQASCREDQIWPKLAEQLKDQVPWVGAEARIDASYIAKVVTSLEASGIPPSKIASILNNLGTASSFLGDADIVVIFLEEALGIYQQVYTEALNHPEIADTFNNLGNAWLALGNARKAVSFYQSALKIYRQVSKEAPSHHLRIAATFSNLGNAWCDLGNARRAMRFLKRALEIYRQVSKETPSHLEMAVILNNLGVVHSTLCNLNKAVDYYNQSLEIYEQDEQRYGINHPDIAMILNNLGDAWGTLGDARKAVSFYQRALEICDQFYDKNNPNRVMVFENLENARRALEKAKTLTCPRLGLYESLNARSSYEV